MAPQLVGLLTATPGSLQKVLMPAATGEIVVRNDSPYDVWVRLGSTPPAAAPSALNLSQYHQEVTPGQTQIRVPQPFDGCLWVGTYNPGGKASSGTISSRANIYVRAYPIGESAGAGATYAALTGLDATSQQRVIAIPVVPHIAFDFDGLALAANNFELEIVAPSLASFSPVVTTPITVTVYLYHATLSIVGVRRCAIGFDVKAYDSGGVLLGSGGSSGLILPLFSGNVLTFEPFSAFPWSAVAPTGCATLKLMIQTFNSWPASSGTNALLYGEVELDIDLSGQAAPPAIGNGIATPPGAIY